MAGLESASLPGAWGRRMADAVARKMEDLRARCILYDLEEREREGRLGYHGILGGLRQRRLSRTDFLDFLKIYFLEERRILLYTWHPHSKTFWSTLKDALFPEGRVLKNLG